jgi:hypothetical protein
LKEKKAMWPSELESLKRRQERAALQRLADYLTLADALSELHKTKVEPDTMRACFWVNGNRIPFMDARNEIGGGLQ